MEIKIKQLDLLYSVEFNGTVIENVCDYKIISSAHGNTELELKLTISNDIKDIVITAMT